MLHGEGQRIEKKNTTQHKIYNDNDNWVCSHGKKPRYHKKLVQLAFPYGWINLVGRCWFTCLSAPQLKLRSIQNGCSSGAESDLQKRGSKTGFGDSVTEMALT